MKAIKLLSLFLAIAVCFGSSSVCVYAEENISILEDDEGFMPTLPPSEEVEISIFYRPIKSYISIGRFGPFCDGLVLKVTYSDGSSELVTVEKCDDELWDYVAGDYYVYVGRFDTTEVKSPGINNKTIVLDGFKEDNINYCGVLEDFKYLYIPSLGECIFLLSSLIRIYNPFK